ncbi:efflux RND transporter periplasmic adaptor subunit [Acidisoma sp.]|jgi:RND family efflux transporter MFP subunit|uniref:efflux RND transporter periplasmic adaptor subunit n=1 Tax=Acidisoma sp. TaxID=1872115 RepID=UPI002D7E188B|nr:efflux RND transporter periplasmic adaptor subunit [Acidisoma sp.]
MDDMTRWSEAEERTPPPVRSRFRWRLLVGIGLVAAAGAFWMSPWNPMGQRAAQTAQAAIPPAPVTVSAPLQRAVAAQIGFLGQFSAVDRVDLRAQVGGTLAEIDFKDGQIVKKGDLLFVIDPTPYQIKLSEATAQLTSAQSHLVLAQQELYRAQTLKRTDFGTAENVDQRQADVGAAQSAVDDAKAQIRDAAFDLQHCRITAPFTGRIGAHQVSVGSLIAGSRYASGTTTLLATIVSLDPIHLDFDMSEADYLTFSRERAATPGPLADQIAFHLSDETQFTHQGTLDFVDNEIDRSSGTIHARATVSNPNLLLTPGAFARIRLAVAPPAPALLVPDAAVLLDQNQHIVMTVAPDGTVVPKPVDTGDLRGGLRIIRSGLAANDRVIINGLMRAMPGAKVTPEPGAIAYNPADDKS